MKPGLRAIYIGVVDISRFVSILLAESTCVSGFAACNSDPTCRLKMASYLHECTWDQTQVRSPSILKDQCLTDHVKTDHPTTFLCVV